MFLQVTCMIYARVLCCGQIKLLVAKEGDDANKFPPTTNTESHLIDGHLCSCDVLITEISPLFE